MSWTTPLTRATGDLVTAASWNTDVRDNLLEVWHEVAYNEFTSAVAATNTTEATANTVVTASAVSFSGSNIVLIEFSCPHAACTNTVAGSFWLYDGASSIGRIGLQVVSSAPLEGPVRLARRLTPSNASHTYSIRASVSSGTFTLDAGAGGAGNYMPGFIRILQKG